VAEFHQTGQIVKNQLNADTINLYFYTQQELRKRQWRFVEFLYYPALEFSERWAERFGEDICLALVDAFQPKNEYRRFNAIFYQYTGLGTDGMAVMAIAVCCHQFRFLAALKRRARERVLRMRELLALDEGQILLEQQKDIQSWAEKWKGWEMSAEMRLLEYPSASELIYDPDANRIAIKPLEALDLDPKEYVDHLSTTSDLLAFVGSLNFSLRHSESPTMYLGNLGWRINIFP
jgi:hypothetical protein